MISLHKPNTNAKFRLPQLYSKECESTISKKKKKKQSRCFTIRLLKMIGYFYFFSSTVRKISWRNVKLSVLGKLFDCVSEKFKLFSSLLYSKKQRKNKERYICFLKWERIGYLLTNIIPHIYIYAKIKVSLHIAHTHWINQEVDSGNVESEIVFSKLRCVV